jgi:hypothetical protein
LWRQYRREGAKLIADRTYSGEFKVRIPIAFRDRLSTSRFGRRIRMHTADIDKAAQENPVRCICPIKIEGVALWVVRFICEGDTTYQDRGVLVSSH